MGVYIWTGTPSTVLAHYPLTSTSTTSDTSGNGKNLTQSGTVTFGTYGGVDCAYFNGGYLYINESLVLGANPRTISCWFNRQNTPSEGGAFWGMGTASSTNGITTYLHGNAPLQGHYGYGNRQNDFGFNQMPTVGAWGLLTVTYTGTNILVYLDGTYLGTPTYSDLEPTTTALTLNLTSGKTAIAQMPHFGAGAWKGYMSDFIFDGVCWSASDVADYYNDTKGNYERQPISYSYSFKNKTKTNLTEDGWSGTMNGTIDSGGLHGDGWAMGKQLDFSGASLITLTEYVNITQKSDWNSGSCRICVGVTNGTNSQYGGGASTLEASGYRGTRCEKANGSTSWNNVSLGTGEGILESVIDVTNASITTTYSRSGSVVSTSTTTLTSTDIANLLSYTYVLVTTNGNGCYIQGIEVEAQ